MKKNKLIFLAFLFLLQAGLSSAQSDKNVKVKDVPAAVKDYLQKNYPEAHSVKYYKEIEGDTTFYEITFRNKTDQYNLLLFPDGRIYETEIVMRLDQLPASTKDNIVKDLTARYSKYTIRLVEQLNPKGTMKYEIKVHAKKGKRHGYFEVFYDSNGNFTEEEEEILKSIPSNSGF
ncbi:MAG TPA: PepSY-like domain-containing protein [Cytophagaceae bacterium]|jgi:hypothetical protein|nr:PepSY-like domain-containing protein [Cytophagaceae bacterium]